jgi:signal transduction histidine kinase
VRDTDWLPDPLWPETAAGWIDLACVVFWILGLIAIVVFGHWEAIPLQLIWVAFALIYSFRIRNMNRRFDADAARMALSEQSARLLASQRSFLQDASHQLRTPITIALGHSELLARSLVDKQDKRDINVIVGELNRLRALSEHLLLISASADPRFLRPEPAQLDQFVLGVLARWRRAADRHWQLGRTDEVRALIDSERLRLAVDALLENAVQHTGPGDVIRLSVVHEPGSAFACMVVEDTGSGIAEIDLAHIFDRFATGPAASGTGTGLGLALVSAVAQGHAGDVRVQSTVGQGSRFEILLPADVHRLQLPAPRIPLADIAIGELSGPGSSR